MRKIAIIQSDTRYSSYGDDYETIINKITNFEEVTEETYQLLVKYQHRYNYSILEQPIDQNKFIVDTIAEILNRIDKDEKERLKKKAQEEARKADRLLKKKAKDEVAEKKLLAQLLEKHGVPEQ